MIIDGKEWSEKEIVDALRQKGALEIVVKKLQGPFTCAHNPEFVAGACAACHAIWIDAAERAESLADVRKQQFDALLVEAMNRLCPDQKKCDSGTCPGVDLGTWATRQLASRSLVGKPSTHCPECHGSGEFGLADGEVPCQSCCGSGDRRKKGIFYQQQAKK